MNNKHLLSALLGAITFSSSAYELTEPQSQPLFESTFRTQSGAPDVHFGKLNKDCDSECTKVLYIGGYKHTFHHTAELVTSARFHDRAFALVKQMHQKKSGKKSSRDDYHFVSGARNTHRTGRYLCSGAKAKGFSYAGELLCLEDNKLDIYTARSERSYELPMEADFGQINNNLAGTVAIAYVNADKRVLNYVNLYNLDRQGNSAWQELPTRLHDRSDRVDVIATYPVNRAKGLVGMYEYINPFNKGLTLYSFDGENSARRVITNSEVGNFGFDPQVFVYGNQYVLTAESTNTDEDDKYQTYVVSPHVMNEPETYSNEMSTKSQFDFMAGYGLMNNYWNAEQSVGDDIETEYKIDSSLMHTVYVQARYSDTQVSLKYLTNQAKESGPQGTSEAVSTLTGLVDFNGFFQGADTLRFKMDWTKTDGIATYKSKNSKLCLVQGCEVSQAFSTEYKNIETLVLGDGGRYFGLSYSTYAMPSAIGFTNDQDSGRVLGAALDEDYKQQRVMFVVGSDEAAYGARYETDYDRFFFRPNIGFGVVKHEISSEAEKIARNGLEGDIVGEYGFVLSGGVDAGYIYQRRWREAAGLGYSIQGGLRARLDWTTDNWFMDASDDDIYFDYDRLDIMWGPYVQVNVIF